MPRNGHEPGHVWSDGHEEVTDRRQDSSCEGRKHVAGVPLPRDPKVPGVDVWQGLHVPAVIGSKNNNHEKTTTVIGREARFLYF